MCGFITGYYVGTDQIGGAQIVMTSVIAQLFMLPITVVIPFMFQASQSMSSYVDVVQRKALVIGRRARKREMLQTKRMLRSSYGQPYPQKRLVVIQKQTRRKRRGRVFMSGDKVRCIEKSSARAGHTGTLKQRFGGIKSDLWSVAWIGPPATQHELETRAQLDAFSNYDRGGDFLGLELSDMSRRSTLQLTRKRNMAAIRIQKLVRGRRARKAVRRVRFRLEYYQRYHMNKYVAWLFMDCPGSLAQKAVRLNRMAHPPKISFCEAGGLVAHSARANTDIDTLQGWSGMIAHIRREGIVRIQRCYRVRYAKLMRARNIILTAIRRKVNRMRVHRRRELNKVKAKFTVAKILLVGLIYSVVAVFTLFCIGLQLIFGVKFDFEMQLMWIQAYWMAMFLELVPMSLLRIMISWLLPPYWLWLVIIPLAIGIVAFGTQCEEILTDPLHRTLVCESLPF